MSAPASAERNVPVLEVKDLSIWREGVPILKDLNWQVLPGEHWVIIGANGSGKTSLLAALTAYLEFSRGTVRLLGKTFGETDWRELRKRVGLVSSAIRQKVPDHETPIETVVSGRHAMIDYWGDITPAERREAARLLKSSGLEHALDRPWAVLSQGERQRVLIARALMARCQLLILDEPCAGLDPVAREDFLHFLQTLGQKPNSPTLVLVTHHVEEITPTFTHVLLLSDGQVSAAGPLSKALNSQQLSRAFGRPLRLSRRGGRYSLDLLERF
jgi:iron complex transport system ATP-binding protein